MIDGITIRSQIRDFEAWKKAVNLSLFLSVGSDTGEVRARKRYDQTTITHRGKFETFEIIVKDVTNEATGKHLHYLTVKGSFHKNHFNGTNYRPFTFQDLQEEIYHLCKNLCISPDKAQISILEIGLNVSLPFAVMPFIRHNIISYKGKSFSDYKPDRKGISLGIVCQRSQYAVKIYDKGLQFELPDNLIRVELRFLKMQSLNRRGIKYLSDLQNLTRLNDLQKLLFQAWNNILIFDIAGEIEKLPFTKREKDFLKDGWNPKFWEGLKEKESGNKYKYWVKKFRKLVVKYGNNWQTIVLNLLKNEWQNLFKNYPNLPSGQIRKLPEFTIKIKGKNGEKVLSPEKRYCLSCGKELNPAQRANSKFCSAKFVGYEKAHQCRNNNSNPRNRFKRKIETIRGRGLLFDIIPYIDPGKAKKYLCQ